MYGSLFCHLNTCTLLSHNLYISSCLLLESKVSIDGSVCFYIANWSRLFLVFTHLHGSHAFSRAFSAFGEKNDFKRLTSVFFLALLKPHKMSLVLESFSLLPQISLQNVPQALSCIYLNAPSFIIFGTARDLLYYMTNFLQMSLLRYRTEDMQLVVKEASKKSTT